MLLRVLLSECVGFVGDPPTATTNNGDVFSANEGAARLKMASNQKRKSRGCYYVKVASFSIGALDLCVTT
jgi:hypothetical protein